MKKAILMATLSLTLSFCFPSFADTANDGPEEPLMSPLKPTPTSEQDPLESINRPIFNFNQGLDTYFMTPVSKGYNAVVPNPIRTAANNFFENISMLSTTGNDILQGEFKQSIFDAWRFVINSTFGIGGLIDVAAEFGLPKHFNDMGITFAKWGYKDSTYLVFPVLGSSNIRDTIGFSIDYYMSPYPYIRPTSITYGLIAFRYLTIKAQLVDANKLINEVALDPYTFTRDAYYQYRNKKIHDSTSDNTQYLYKDVPEPQDEKPGADYVAE
jgi:phospholipid-binding lipoprotein MlaA